AVATPLHAAAQLGNTVVAQILIHAGANVNALDNCGWTPIYAAASEGHEGVVRLLIDAKADVCRANTAGYTPVYVAAQNGYLEAVKLLLEAGGDPAKGPWAGSTPRDIAAKNGHMRVARYFDSLSMTPEKLWHAANEGDDLGVKQLLRNGVDVNAADYLNQTALHFAASKGHSNVVATLLAAKAQVDSRSKNGSTPLFLAARSGQSTAVSQLLAAGATPNAANDSGQAPLSGAAQYGQEAVVGLLLAAGADVNHRDSSNATAMHRAAESGHAKVVEMLLGASADATGKTTAGNTPRSAAVQKGHHTVVAAMDRILGPQNLLQAAAVGDSSTIQQLVQQGVDVNTTSPAGATPLYLAASRGHDVSVLLAANANADATTSNGKTPLHVAAAEGHASVVAQLINAEASVNCADKEKQTPLHLAVLGGHTDVVRLLVNAGADHEARSSVDKTPRMLATEMKKTDILKLLSTASTTRAVAPPPQGSKELLDAIKATDVAAVKKLLTNGANANSTDEAGQSLLHLAVLSGQRSLVDALLGVPGIHPAQRNPSMETPLTLAVKHGHRLLAQLIYSAAHERTRDVTEDELVIDPLRPLGQGGYGAVYKGTYRNEPVAVKTVLNPSMADALVYEMEAMQQYASVCANTLGLAYRCNSPYLLELLAVADPHSSTPKLVLEYMDGGDLRQYLNKKRLGLPTPVEVSTMQVAWVVANALADLHHNGLLHRDLKSLNILLCSKNYIKLADLGLARECASQMTTMMGTPYWMAPEVLTSGTSYDYAADIYSFGVILTELDTLQMPFADLNLNKWDILDQVRQGTLRPSVRANCEPWLRQLAENCMAFDPKLRPSAQAIVDYLHRQRSSPPETRSLSTSDKTKSRFGSTISSFAKSLFSAPRPAATESTPVGTRRASTGSSAAKTATSSISSISSRSSMSTATPTLPIETTSLSTTQSYSSWATSTLVSTTLVCPLCKTTNSVLASACKHCAAPSTDVATKLRALLKRIEAAKRRGIAIDTTFPCVVCETPNTMTATVCGECDDELPDDTLKLKIIVAIIERAMQAP
ncbi:hypothetical protein ACHHYP_06362, partial [Achlya hypogyna]